MGCNTSRHVPGVQDYSALTGRAPREDGDLKLPYSKISYSSRQLEWLGEKFSKLEESARGSEALRERQVIHVGVVVERLIQRLICNVGTMDPRFASKFLISLQSPHNRVFGSGKRLSFKYLVRLDALSTPPLYPECFRPPVKVVEGFGMDTLPAGFAKVRVHGEYLEEWSEFINPNGLLRRDKIQERFIELLAKAAARPTDPSCPAQVDESKLCGSPGKIVDPITLHHILKLPSSHHVFYGAAECNESRFPDPRDFRIAIVEGTPETRLHISFLSPTAQTLIGEGDVEIVLTIGIGSIGWPGSSDYPARYPLDHVDVILGYQSVQMDYYVVPKGPHHSIRCEDRSTIWEIRALTTEMFLEYHYSPSSPIGRVFRILGLLLESLRARGVKTINRYVLKNLILFELETKRKMEQWMPKSIPRRVLSILDHLLSGLRSQSLPTYIFKRKNLLLQEEALEEDYVSDGDIVEHYLRQLSHEGTWSENEEKYRATIKDQLENVMLQKWTDVVTNLLPPISNRGRRLSVTEGCLVNISYTRRQMEYVALLFREILKLRHIQLQQSGKELPGSPDYPDESRDRSNPTEDLIFLLQIMFGQARQRACSEMTSRLTSKGCEANRKKYKFSQMIRSYDVSTSMLIDDLRRNNRSGFSYHDDMNLVAKVIECLYKATDSDPKILGPVLRPYLNQLFRGSHENCWFLPEWKKKMEDLEFQAIGAFSSLVVAHDIDPLSGILDSAHKEWNWAKNCIRIMQSIRNENSASVIIGDKIDTDNSGLRILFTPSPQKTIRCTVSLSKMDEFDPAESTGAQQKSALRLCFERQPPHARLRDANPFTLASMEARRQGNHRGLGSIVQALISLQKLTVLQEISQFLPQEEKRKVLNDIKKLSKEVQRLTISNCRKRYLSATAIERSPSKAGRIRDLKPKWRSATLPGKMSVKTGITGVCNGPAEIYRSVNEFCNDDRHDDSARQTIGNGVGAQISDDSLLGTCRLVRRHERQRAFGPKGCEIYPGTGRFGKAPSSTLPKNAINTPFYLRVTTPQQSKAPDGIRRHKTDPMQF